MYKLTLSISRNNIALRVFDESVIVSSSLLSEQMTEYEFYTPAVALLALIYDDFITPEIN